METLNPTWYLEPPIDFEHKQYLLFAHLQVVDGSFLRKQVSPYLLRLERIERELVAFERAWQEIRRDFDRQRYLWFPNPKLQGEQDELVEMVREIVEFAQPQIHQRIETGYRILERYRQVLW